jgi:hypothetical protein
LSDYQRKDLAKAGIRKVIYQYEQIVDPKRKDTLSIRQYNSDGFLIALDSFEMGKTRLQFLASQKIFYSRNGKLTIMRIEAQQISRDYFGTTTVLQSFDETKKLIGQTIISGKDTSVLNYNYDVFGNLTETVGYRINKTNLISDSYAYEYDSNKKIIREEYRIKSKLSDVKRYKYNQAELIVEIRPKKGPAERFDYDENGRKISREFICEASTDNYSGDKGPWWIDGKFYLYTYNDQGQLSRIKHQEVRCDPLPEVISEYEETLTYLPSGLLEIRCGPSWCYRHMYLKK